MSNVNLAAEMDRFRERLLDLSNRNPLLNYRKSRWRTLEILRKRPDQVFERLVNDGKRFRFEPLVPIEEEQLALAVVDSGDAADDAPASHAGGAAPGNAVGPFDGLADDGRGPADDRLQTALAPELMESVLKSMAREALTAIEETGVNYLFLAIGMLEWREREDSEKGHLAPLILVPVSIDRSFNGRSLKYEYSITWQGDELQYNLCLAKRMEKDFGLRLPEYDGEQFPEQYFAEVEKAIAPKTNWAVRRDHLIGFFSFQKMLMYLDLDPRTWELKGKLSLDSVAGTLIAGQDAEADSCLYAPDYEIDLQRDARMIGLITDADSSQHSALLDVQQGKNLVIEGPPGTGKSQTITNAIAAAIHSGKTVLFVAEKLAALKVVSDRLGELGLGKFCLELHSDAGPRHVFESLKERMNSGFDEPHELQSVREDLERKRKMIGDYLAATSQPAGPYGEPLYEVMWRIIELRSRRIRSARQALFAADVDRSDFDDNVQLLEAFVETLAEVQQPRTSPWWGFWATSVNPNDVEPIARALDEMHAIGDDVAVAAANLQETCGEGLVQWIAERDVVDPASFLRMANEISPLSISHDLSVFQNAQCRELGRELANAVEQARALLSESSRYLLEDRGDAEGAAPAIRQIIRQRLKSAVGAATVKNLRGLKSKLNTLLSVLTRVEAIASALKSQGFGPIRTIREYHTAEDLFRYLRHPILNAVSELPPALFLAQAPGTFKQSRAEAEQLTTAREELSKAFQWSSLPDAETLSAVVKRLRPYADRWWRFLSKNFRAAKRDLLEFSRSGIGSTPKKWISNLEKLEDHLAAETKFRERAGIKATLGELFQGLDTDWERAGTLLQWAATVAHRGLDHASATQLLAKRTTDALRSTQVVEGRQQLTAELSQPDVAASLGLGSSVEMESWNDIRKRAETLLADIERFESTTASIALTDEMTLDEVDRRAAMIEQAGKLRDRCLDAEPWKDLGTWRQDLDTDVNTLRAAIAWVEALRGFKLPEHAESRILAENPAEACHRLANCLQALDKARQQWTPKRLALQAFGRLDDSWLPLIDASTWTIVGPANVVRLRERLDDLPAWAAFCRVLTRCQSANLASFTDLSLDEKVELDQLAECYRLSVFERVVEAKLAELRPLADFSRQTLEKAREQFRLLDKQLLRFTQRQIAYDASKRKASAGTSKGRVAEFTEMGLIRHEIQKQRRHCRIRDLLLRAGGAVQALKPCFMMSPLSVAQYLAPEGIQFDLVIMDEASQIKPEDALGTVLRAKQLVVVGDPKQLPPTSFFDRVEDEVKDDEATQFDNAESVLEAAMKAFQPVRRLRWHYRSQHESLIHFSNDRFYDRDLVVFPSASTEASQLGIRYHFVENATLVGNTNIEEAKAVAAAIVEHARQFPQETLGVGTFNLKQRDAIYECLDKICEQDASSREAIDRLNENHEQLFIKNLENLQGDERDVIIVSYTYGPDPDSGKVMNNFGPITRAYGWRRLNVLITRARRRVEVFSSMRASDILGGPDKSLGVNSMKDYLEFARSGSLPDRGLASGRSPDSPFEVAVGRVITRMGLQVVPQVGVAGYFIDLGVLRPGSTGDFLLGVECDGATYHSAKSARDRDRLRQEVISRRGWNLHRIWSTDWFLNQKHEEERLMEAIRQAMSKLPAQRTV